MSRPSISIAFGISLLTAAAPVVHAQEWTWASLHPSGWAESWVRAVGGGRQAGYTREFVGGPGRAALWSGSASSWIDVHPKGAAFSHIFGSDGTQHVGEAYFDINPSAVLWSERGWTNLNPPGMAASRAWGVAGGQQVGFASLAGQNEHAGYWTGSASSWVDLHPAGAVRSTAHATTGAQQAGYVDVAPGVTHAALWSGTAQSWIDLHPQGFSGSMAGGAWGPQQVGAAYLPTGEKFAGLWNGSASSWVNLHPSGWQTSSATATNGQYQVGATEGIGFGTGRAALWQGTAASWFNLGAVLPSYYADSVAFAIDGPAGSIVVGGFARNTLTGDLEAILWAQIPSPGTLALVAVAGAWLGVRRRRS